MQGACGPLPNKVGSSQLHKIKIQGTVLCSYFNKNEGVIIQIIHTGKTSKDIFFTGTIIDFGKPIFVEQYDKFYQIFGPILALTMPTVFLLFMFTGFFHI